MCPQREPLIRDDAMREAHDRAVTRLVEVRARWTNRAATGEKVFATDYGMDA